MPSWEDARLETPAGLCVAGWRDFCRLNRLSWSGLGIAALHSAPFRVMLSFLLLTMVLLVVTAALCSPDLLMWALVYVGLIVVATTALMGVLVLRHCAVRLMDNRRQILLTPDRMAVLDVIVTRHRSGWRIMPANHMKLTRSSTASALRASLADWMQDSDRDDIEARIVAQNRRVAELYASQFPQLRVISRRNWGGRVLLELRDAKS